jgi:hypothetical protein
MPQIATPRRLCDPAHTGASVGAVAADRAALLLASQPELIIPLL